MSSSTIVVTGATGFIGGHVAANFVARGHRVICLRRPGSESSWLKGVEWQSYDEWAHSEEPCQAVVHAAAVRHRHGVPAETYVRENTRLGDLMLSSAKGRVQRFVDVSSISVFGWPEKLPIDDTNAFDPVGPYGRSKVLCEEAVRRSGLPYVIVRPSITYGPHDTNGMIDKLFRLLHAGKFRVVGNGKSRVQLVYVADLAHGITEAALKPGIDGREFTCTYKDPISMQELAELAAQTIGRKLPRPNAPLWAAKMGALAFETAEKLGVIRGEPLVTFEKIAMVTVDRAYRINRMREALGWEPQVGYREGLRLTAQASGLLPS